MKRAAERHAHLSRTRGWRTMRMILSVLAWACMAAAAISIVTGGGS